MGESNCVDMTGIDLEAGENGESVLKVQGQAFSLSKAALARLVRKVMGVRPMVDVCHEPPYVLHVKAYCLEEDIISLQHVDADGAYHMAIACENVGLADECLRALRAEAEVVEKCARYDGSADLEFSIDPLAVPEDDFDTDEFVYVDSVDGALFALRHLLAFDMSSVTPDLYWDQLGLTYKTAPDEFDWPTDVEYTVVEPEQAVAVS